MRITNPCKSCLVQPVCKQMCEKLPNQYKGLKKLQKIMLITYGSLGIILISLIYWNDNTIVHQVKNVIGWIYAASVLFYIISDRKADKVKEKIDKMEFEEEVKKFGVRSMKFTTRKAR